MGDVDLSRPSLDSYRLDGGDGGGGGGDGGGGGPGDSRSDEPHQAPSSKAHNSSLRRARGESDCRRRYRVVVVVVESELEVGPKLPVK